MVEKCYKIAVIDIKITINYNLTPSFYLLLYIFHSCKLLQV